MMASLPCHPRPCGGYCQRTVPPQAWVGLPLGLAAFLAVEQAVVFKGVEREWSLQELENTGRRLLGPAHVAKEHLVDRTDAKRPSGLRWQLAKKPSGDVRSRLLPPAERRSFLGRPQPASPAPSAGPNRRPRCATHSRGATKPPQPAARGELPPPGRVKVADFARST